MGEFSNYLTSKTPPFKALRYVLEEIPIVSPMGIYVKFRTVAVAYRVPEERYPSFTIPENWFWASKEWPQLHAGMPSCCVEKKDRKKGLCG